jgi:hypothetical protein
MAYRPHFAYPTPPGFVDELADYPFDYRQVGDGIPVVDTDPPVGSPIGNSFTLALDADAPFLWRALIYDYPDPYFFLAGQVAARIRDAYGNYLSSDFIPFLNLGQCYYVTQPWTGVNAATPPAGPHLCAPMSVGMGVPLVDEIYCPASGTLSIDLYLLNSSFDGTPDGIGRMIARGVKRRPKSDCGPGYR